MEYYLAENDLRGQVLWSTTQSPGATFHSLSETKICDLQCWHRENYFQFSCILITLPWGTPDYQAAGFLVSSLCRWDPNSEDTQMPKLFGLHRSVNVPRWNRKMLNSWLWKKSRKSVWFKFFFSRTKYCLFIINKQIFLQRYNDLQ